ncbi:MAG TPA: filamentous hemagglutinin N-terminal domain-containing protein, partial [Allocoleopsis sp.]
MIRPVFRCWSAGYLLVGCLVTASSVQAQIVPDGTLPVNSVVMPGCVVCTIEGGTVRGVNLFHSFREFSVPTGGEAFFNNPTQIETIFSRVTGSSVSNIDGLLRANGTVSLFFLNPNGVLFGPNARLEIGGSFVASTASSFRFPDGSEFSATNPQAPPLLTVNVTPGVQWGASQPGATITNRGRLATGQDLTLLADKLDLQGQLQAGRDLTLLAQDTVRVRDALTTPFIASAGRHLMMQGNQSIDILALNHPQSQLQSGGNLSLIGNGDISGDARFFSGGNFSMLTLSGTPGNFVSWFDPIIQANGDVRFGNYTGVALKVEATGSIQGGNIRITGAECAAGSLGCVGSIAATDPDFVTLTGSPSVILRAGLASVTTPTTFPYPAGGASFTAATGLPLGITVGSIDTSRSDGGNGGDIILSAANGNINANQILSGVDRNSGNAGNAGNIIIQASGNIVIAPALNNSGAVDASTIARNGTWNAGNSGNIQITSISGNITVNGGIFANSTAVGAGSTAGVTGNITLQAPQGTISVTGNTAGVIVT